MSGTKNYSYFCNEKCEYFPCHENIAKEDFSCLFCYCPLYFLGDKCGGNYKRLENGIKDCSRCLFPHRRENFDEMMRRIAEHSERMKLPE